MVRRLDASCRVTRDEDYTIQRTAEEDGEVLALGGVSMGYKKKAYVSHKAIKATTTSGYLNDLLLRNK